MEIRLFNNIFHYKQIIFITASLASIILFWVFKQKYPFLGDGTMRVNDNVIVKGSYAFGIYYYLYLLLKKIFVLSNATEYLQLTNSILGGIYVYVTLLISDSQSMSMEAAMLGIPSIRYVVFQEESGFWRNLRRNMG